MKHLIAGLVLSLSLGSVGAIADDTVTVNLSGGSVSFAVASAPGGWGKVGTENTLDLNAAVWNFGNGVYGNTSGESSTYGEGSDVAAQGGVLGELKLVLSPDHIFGSGGTEQLADVDGDGYTHAWVHGETELGGWIDPVRIQGDVHSYSFDSAWGPNTALGQNGGQIWLDLAVQH